QGTPRTPQLDHPMNDFIDWTVTALAQLKVLFEPLGFCVEAIAYHPVASRLEFHGTHYHQGKTFRFFESVPQDAFALDPNFYRSVFPQRLARMFADHLI